MHDWQDVDYYRAKRTRPHWAWEFMRRNATYQADHSKLAAAWRKAQLPGSSYLMGAGASEVEDLACSLGAKWGQLGRLADPRRQQPPIFIANSPVWPDGDTLESFFHWDEDTESLRQADEYATLTFDVRRPLKEQLKRARSYLLKRQSVVKKLTPVREHSKNWPDYLLVLDAKLAKASNTAIAKLFPRWDELEKFEVSKRIATYHARAKKLRDNPISIFL